MSPANPHAFAAQGSTPSEPPVWKRCSPSPVNLVLEGGAMRGQFTAGVLDFFLDQGLLCENVFGTSAGALTGYYYVAGARGRSCLQNVVFCDDWRYLSLKSYVRTGNAYGREFAFYEIPDRLLPFDYADFDDSPMNLVTVAANLETGEADYHPMKDARAGKPYLIASSSMPLVSQVVEVDGKLLLDGGACDSVPIEYSWMHDGFGRKNIVVLTQDATYVKGPNKLMPLISQRYRDYPYYVERLANRHIDYNRTYRAIARWHDEGRLFCIRPPKPVEIGSMEKDPEKLLALYEEGYRAAADAWPALQSYLAS
uniref:Patatin family protein n=1 Tax=Muribaculaceae bacterium Z82 TaxID=2304548 RepID=A0A7C9NMH6_9BACT